MTEKNTSVEKIPNPNVDLFQTLVENSMDVITLLDEKGRMLYQNPSFENLFGYGQKELLNREVLTLVHPDDLVSTSEKLGNLLKKASTEERHELRFLHRNGDWLRIEVQARLIETEDSVRVVITSRDVSESHNTLEKLRQSNELFQTAFHASANLCALSRLDTGEFIDVNRAFEKVIGWTREEAISQSSSKMNIWGSPEKRQFIMSRLLADNELSQLPFSINSRTGDTIDVLIDAKILMISGVKCAYFSSMDVTATKKLEDQLRQSQKMEAVGQLTGGIAHDFNNLLSVILGNSEIIQMELEQDNKLQPSIEAILKATHLGAGLTHQLLAFSRKQTLQPVSVSLNKVVGHTVSMLNQSLSEDILIQTNIDDDLWPIEVDPGQLENAILNLALNSRDAMHGGGTITISYSNKSLTNNDALFDDLIPGDYVSLAFSDTGIGMPENVAQQVFEPFFTTKEIGQGTGLGLSMVFGFVKQSGGQVYIQSEQQLGTTVTILLPRCEMNDLAAPAKKIQTVSAEWHGQTALLVEDNAEVRKLTARMLEQLGFEVLKAENGDVAVEILAQAPAIDFLLSDVILPGELKGPDVARSVAAAFPKAAILLMSGFNPEQSHTVKTRLISKPFTNTELISWIQAVYADKD